MSARPSAAIPTRMVAGSILAFWAGFFLLMSARGYVLGFAEAGDLIARRLACAAGGVALTSVFWGALLRLRAAPLSVQVAAALGGAAPVTAAYAALNAWIFYGLKPPPSLADDIARWGFARVFRYAVVDTSVAWYFFFAGGALFLLVLQYAVSTAASARRAAEAERAAHLAELRALRYQLNPHFLFNSLNALSCLVLEGRTRDADRMILDLSALLRRILADAPEGDVTLEDEAELQRLYLAIEGRRFGDRLTTLIDVPPDLAHLCVPPLILQPLVENAVKHGLGGSARAVHISVSARRDAGLLVLEVANTGSCSAGAQPGHGIGLANIRERLALRHGSTASLDVGPTATGGFTARVCLPAVTHV